MAKRDDFIWVEKWTGKGGDGRLVFRSAKARPEYPDAAWFRVPRDFTATDLTVEPDGRDCYLKLPEETYRGAKVHVDASTLARCIALGHAGAGKICGAFRLRERGGWLMADLKET